LAQIIKEIKLETLKPNFIKAITGKQHDKDSRFLKVSLVADDVVIPIESNSSVFINAVRKDGERRSFSGVANEDNTVTVPLTYWMLELWGVVDCDVSVVDTEGRRLTSTSFKIDVEPSANQGCEIPEDDITIIVPLVGNLEELKTNNKNNLVEAINELYDSGGSVDVDLSNYVTKDMMPEIDVDEVVEKVNNSINLLKPMSDGWLDNSNIVRGSVGTNPEIRTSTEWKEFCVSPLYPISPDKKYLITPVTTLNTGHPPVIFCDSEGQAVSHNGNIAFLSGDRGILITPATKSAFIRLSVYKRFFDNNSYNNNIDFVVSNFYSTTMLVECDSNTESINLVIPEYVPYAEGGYKLNENVQLPDNIEIPNVPTKTSELENDSGFITADDIPEASGVPTKVSELENDAGYITLRDIPEGGNIDLSDYAKKDEMPTKTSELENDSEYITLNDLPECNYVLTEADKTEIAELSAGLIDTALLSAIGSGVLE
jgi:hypothetical protein